MITNRTIRSVAILLFLCVAVSLSSADPVFKLSKKRDISLMAAGTVVCGTGLALNHLIDADTWDEKKRNRDDINDFDRPFAHAYDKSLDTFATVYMFGLIAAPAALCLIPDSDWFTLGVMYAEAMLFSQGIKEGVKGVVARYRPYTYFDDPDYGDDEAIKSWPSGHTTAVFTSASFLSYVFWNYYPDSSYRFVVATAAMGAATAEGIMRIKSGNHFVTDVISGAILGTACGVLVPMVHKCNKNSDKQIVLYGNGVGMRLQLG